MQSHGPPAEGVFPAPRFAPGPRGRATSARASRHPQYWMHPLQGSIASHGGGTRRDSTLSGPEVGFQSPHAGHDFLFPLCFFGRVSVMVCCVSSYGTCQCGWSAMVRRASNVSRVPRQTPPCPAPSVCLPVSVRSREAIAVFGPDGQAAWAREAPLYPVSRDGGSRLGVPMLKQPLIRHTDSLYQSYIAEPSLVGQPCLSLPNTAHGNGRLLAQKPGTTASRILPMMPIRVSFRNTTGSCRGRESPPWAIN